jgi:hypothetical protein
MNPGVKEFTQQLSNCNLTRLDVDTEHYYYADGEYYVSVTQVLGIGAPQPEGLLQWFKDKTPEEIQERMVMTRDRGIKLHHALESLIIGMELYLEEYPTVYEKDAIVTFIRFMRFLVKYGSLDVKSIKSEYIAADTVLKVGGTIDLYARADKRALDILENPTYKLKLVDDNFELIKPLEGKKKMIGFVLDNKFTGRLAYNHKVQAKKYQKMHNASYKALRASEGYIWRYSPKHKFGFDFKDASIHLKQKITAKAFKRIYETTLEFIGGYPDPPVIKVFPNSVRLFEPIKVKEKK